MFKIINRQTGALIDVTAAPLYVRIGKNGSWQACSRAEAQAISVHGTKYSMDEEHPVMEPIFDNDGNQTGEKAAPVATVSSLIDDGTLVFDALHGASANGQHISDIENALCELAIQVATTQK